MTRNLIIALALGASMAQAPADDSRPALVQRDRTRSIRASTRTPRSPFSADAPDAQKVQVQPGGADNGLGKGPIDMTRDDNGVWTVTTPPAVPGFHYYWFLVDGVAVNDPGSETFFGWAKQTSGIEVPEPGVDFYDCQGRAAR